MADAAEEEALTPRAPANIPTDTPIINSNNNIIIINNHLPGTVEKRESTDVTTTHSCFRMSDRPSTAITEKEREKEERIENGGEVAAWAGRRPTVVTLLRTI